MPILAERDRQVIRSLFEPLEGRARVLVFSESPSRLVVPGEPSCTYCRETEALVKELADASGGKVEVQVVDRREQPERLPAYGVDRVPALFITDPQEKLQGVRYFGIPAGYELRALLDTLVDVASGRTRLDPATREQLAAVRRPVHLKVFVTPT